MSRAHAYDIPSAEIALHFWRKAMTETRRDALKKTWIVPLILTWPVLPSFARSGSDDVREALPERKGVPVPLTPTPSHDGETR
jgi:hypothetical protein